MSGAAGNTLLAGFRIVLEAERGAACSLTLDLVPRRQPPDGKMGGVLADLFCKATSGGDRYFEQEAGMARIEETAQTARGACRNQILQI